MTKVKIQTSPADTFSALVGAALAETSRLKAEMRCASGTSSLPHSVVTPGKHVCQIPYTNAKYFSVESIVGLLYKHLFTAPKETYGKTT